MKGMVGLRLAVSATTLMVILGVGTGVASAQTTAPYFSTLAASGGTELQTARYGAVAAALPDGQVLIAGGYDSSSDVLQSAEIFNPAGDTFTAFPASGGTELQTPRAGAAAAALPNGQVLIAGGYDSSGDVLQSAEIFNPATDTFTALPASGTTELQTPRAVAAAAALPDGQVLIAGGESDSSYLQSAELFNPSTDTFTALPASGGTELQAPRFGAAAAALPDGRVLIAGGYNSSGGTLQSAELFSPSTDTFTALPASGGTELQTPRAGAAAAVLPDGQVLITGGVGLSGVLQSAELYDSAPDVAAAGGGFGDQTVGQPSALQPLVLTNLGAQALSLSGAALVGPGNPRDFAIVSDSCAGRTLTFGEHCTITARFTPSTAGMESATIELSDNEPIPSTIALSGTGVAPSGGLTVASGATGPTGATRATGGAQAAGSQRSQGKSAQIYLVTCRTVTQRTKLRGKKHTVTKQRCTTKLISGTTFSTTIAKATLTRNGVIYATGTARLSRLTLHARRPLRAGKYTLTLIRQTGHQRVQMRRMITIG